MLRYSSDSKGYVVDRQLTSTQTCRARGRGVHQARLAWKELPGLLAEADARKLRGRIPNFPNAEQFVRGCTEEHRARAKIRDAPPAGGGRPSNEKL